MTGQALGKHTGYPAIACWLADLSYDLLQGLAGLASLGWERSVRWHAPLPKGPVILAANHPTSLDPFMVMRLVEQRLVFLTSYKLFQLPLVGKLLKAGGMVSAGLGSPRRALQGALTALQHGYMLCVFPEGQISPQPGQVSPLRSGAARIALGARAAIVPVGIYASAEHLHLVPVKVGGRTDHIRWYRRGPYAVTVGEPIQAVGSSQDKRAVRALSEEIATRIAELCAEGRARVERSLLQA
ncbi:MAG: lysophospholipid acyltransferase family protein [Anaerolineales bacterium]